MTVNGTVHSEGDLQVSAESTNAKDDFAANAGVQATPYPSVGGGKVASLLNGFKGGNLFQLDGTSDDSAITASAAVAVGSSTNSAVVTIGATAVLSSTAGLSVTSYAEDNFNLTAVTWATLSQNPDSGGSSAKVSLAGAVAVGHYIEHRDHHDHRWGVAERSGHADPGFAGGDADPIADPGLDRRHQEGSGVRSGAGHQPAVG